MTKFYYSRTHRIVDIPDAVAHLYDGRKRYKRLDPPIEAPEGSVADILEWVGEDDARRQVALQAEQLGKRRVSLLKALAENNGDK